jgi:hypothetical protein
LVTAEVRSTSDARRMIWRGSTSPRRTASPKAPGRPTSHLRPPPRGMCQFQPILGAAGHLPGRPQQAPRLDPHARHPPTVLTASSQQGPIHALRVGSGSRPQEVTSPRTSDRYPNARTTRSRGRPGGSTFLSRPLEVEVGHHLRAIRVLRRAAWRQVEGIAGKAGLVLLVPIVLASWSGARREAGGSRTVPRNVSGPAKRLVPSAHPGGRNHSETRAGCIVLWTTAMRSSATVSRSTSSRRRAVNSAMVRVASYLRR